MAKKKAVATVAPVIEKVTEQFQMQAQFQLHGPKTALEELQRLIRTDETANYVCFDRLIGLPAFTQAGLPVDHPRSEDRWAILMRNTRQKDAQLTSYAISEAHDNFSMVLCFDMTAEVLKANRVDEQVDFHFLNQLMFYFNDLEIMGAWKLASEGGDVIYGLAGIPGLIQQQTEKHKAAGEMFFKKLALPEVVNA